MLFGRDGTLSSVIDSEGMGSGTRVIDVVAFLAHLVATGDTEGAARVARHARDIASEVVYATCVAHRALTLLQWASEHHELLPNAQTTARALELLMPPIQAR
jgi:hypothetical protein